MNKMQFSKLSSRVNHILNNIGEIMNILNNLNNTFKVKITNKIKFNENMEDNEFLEATLLGNKSFYSRETHVQVCMGKINKKISHKIDVH